MLDLGRYANNLVTTDDQESFNQHIFITGTSGTGKTVECQRLICSAVRQGGTAIVLDMHDVFADDQIFSAYKQDFLIYANEVNKDGTGIPCRLFSPMTTGACNESLLSAVE